jgi:arylsulfatase A-like enzyme
MLRQLGFGLAGGLIGGAIVGLGEAIYILGGASTGEYGALIYAAVLYALIGLCGGAGIGTGLAILAKLGRGFSDHRAWSLSFLGILCGLGLVIAKYVVNKVVYLEKGVPLEGLLALLGTFGVIFFVGLWLARILLTQTPLKAVLRCRGTLALYGILLLLAGVFSFSGDPKARSGVLAPEREQSAELGSQPNFLVIMVDTLRADHLGAYGYERDISPNLDILAKDSVVFEKAYGSASWTRASTASLFTSMVPTSHTCDAKVDMLPDDVMTIAEILQNQGYVTGGLPNNINVTRSFNFQQGFDWFDYQAPDYIAGATETASQLSMYNVVRKVRDRLAGEAKRVEDYYQPSDVVLGNAQEFMGANKDRRFFMWAHLMEPHDPYFERPFNGNGIGRAEMEHPPAELKDRIVQSYTEEITWMDVELGKFFGWMKAEGIYDNTVIIITADHGEEFLEHGGWWHGTTLYDEQVHLPLIVKLPGSKWSGTRVPWQVRQLDIAATMAVMGGARVPLEWQGDDLFEEDFAEARDALIAADAPPPVLTPVAEGETAAPAKPIMLLPTKAELISTRERIVLAEENFEGNVLESIRAEGWKYIEANAGNPRGLSERELFDLAVDPGEKDNLAGKAGQRQLDIAQLMRAQFKAAKELRVEGQQTELSMEDCERMRALGYISGDCSEIVHGASKIVPTGAAPE